jgi:hypothetical protein
MQNEGFWIDSTIDAASDYSLMYPQIKEPGEVLTIRNTTAFFWSFEGSGYLHVGISSNSDKLILMQIWGPQDNDVLKFKQQFVPDNPNTKDKINIESPLVITNCCDSVEWITKNTSSDITRLKCMDSHTGYQLNVTSGEYSITMGFTKATKNISCKWCTLQASPLQAIE